MNITNSTFNSNTVTCTGATCQSLGGGIFSFNSILNLTNSTLSGNSVTCNGVSCTKFGGGIASDGVTTLKNTIVADSTGASNCVNSLLLTADMYNIDSDGLCNDATQRTVAQIGLQALAENGGPTQTMALSNASVAIDFADDTVCAAAVGSPAFGAGGLDQRGEARDDLQCDAGAFEFKYDDGDTILKNLLDPDELYTFGPTLAGITSGSFYSPTVSVQIIPGAPGNSPPANALPITWDATAQGGSFSFIVMLCYDPDVLSGQDENSLHVWHYNGSSWDDLGGELNEADYLPYHCVTATTPLTSLSPIILAPSATTAVNVAGLRAKLDQKGRAALKWQTTSESQIAGFTVYRRTGKGEWKEVKNGFVQAKNSGDASPNSYRFKVKKVKADKTYRFQLQVHYLDNHTEWTEVVKLDK